MSMLVCQSAFTARAAGLKRDCVDLNVAICGRHQPVALGNPCGHRTRSIQIRMSFSKLLQTFRSIWYLQSDRCQPWNARNLLHARWHLQDHHCAWSVLSGGKDAKQFL